MNRRLKITFWALLWLSAFSLTAEARSIKYLLNCSSNNNMSAGDIVTWNGFIYDNGRWRPDLTTNDWHRGDETEIGITNGTYSIIFKRITDFYKPDFETRTVANNDLGYTNSYHIYSNTLSVLVTGITTSASASWQLTGSPANEYTNSTFYSTHSSGLFTNTSPLYTFQLTAIPTGTYSFSFNSVRGHHSPTANNVNITGTPYDWFSTNTYIPYSNSLSVVISGVSGVNVVWTNTSYPNDYTNVLTFGTKFTNNYTLSAIPTGSYTITFPALSGYSPTNAFSITTNITGAFNPAITGAYVYLLTGTNDSDGDGLPDEWEVRYGLNPYDPTGTNGASGNVDNDWIPSTFTNTPTLILIDSNNIVYFTFSGDGDPGYPLQRDQLLRHQTMELPSGGSQIGYAKGKPFNNILECRGLDGYYLTNGPNGTWVPNDDPLTSPIWFDTNSSESPDDGISDGWRYYFWYWRSADAYDNGISNSANLSWVTWKRTSLWGVLYIDIDHDTDGDGFTDGDEYSDTQTDPTHCDTDADSMDDYWEINFAGASSNALDYINNWSNPDGDYMAWFSQGILSNGMVGTALGTNVCWSGGSAASPNAAWNEIYTNTGANVFDLYKDTILKASANLTNHVAGARYAFTNYYGTNASMGTYKNGYPVWVDVDNSGTYSSGDYALVNPSRKHDAIYIMAPTTPYPGVCSFDPKTAWTNVIYVNIVVGNISFMATNFVAPNTTPYTTYQEYLGGDYIGRLSWDAGGQMIAENDSALALNRNSYSNPQNLDTDIDQMPDGWELYTGLDPNNITDASLDADGDGLINADEWANATHQLRTCVATWPWKLLPTDPGIITAPQPNDPHPRDTDWDGVSDGDEQTPLSNPTSWDTDWDGLPDGWEIYAGTSITNVDALTDIDNDGLLNYQEYWCGAVPEWQLCNPAWQTIRFCVRRAMSWDFRTATPIENTVFIPPDYISDPCFMYVNNVYTDLGYLRTNYPAASALNCDAYHTPRADNRDSDGDNMDDYWEVYHGLNPCRGAVCLVASNYPNVYEPLVNYPDADPATPGYQFGLYGSPFAALSNYISYVEPYRDNLADRITPMHRIVGPFNFGLNGMDPDGDGLPNLEEYSFTSNKVFYHTDPTPIWRTDQNDINSFIFNNYSTENAPWWGDWDNYAVYPFKFETVEGYDTDNDGVSDYAEINSAAGQTGNNPLDDRNPIRNRALYFNGTNDFARQVRYRPIIQESDLMRFCVEAWIKPDNPALTGNQVVMEKAGLYEDPLNPGHTNVGANFRMGITNGLPYVLYNGRGSLRSYQATAQMKHRITSNTNWTHVAGSYDGTNLVIYVNGEESLSLRTTELPVNQWDLLLPNGLFYSTAHTIIVGARDRTPGYRIPIYDLSPADYFGGCIDEIRVWNGARTRAEILANKNRRLTQSDITNSMTAIYNYFTFDNVPDPNRSGEAVYPAGMADISPDMHPTIAWWQNHAFRSTVYTGITNSYNYMVYASDHAWHSRPIFPAADDYYHFSTNYTGTNAISGYVNPGNPYHQNYRNANYIYDLLLCCGARSVTTNSWLSGLTDDPDSTDSDGDGLPDWWEQLYNLDPYDATGNNGAWGDPDNDGLNNRAEYLAGTSPRNSDTDGDGIGDYDSRSGPYHRTWGEMYMDGDGMPDTWEMQYGLDPYHYDAHLDLDNDGWSNLAEYQAGTNPNDATSYPLPHVTGTVGYFGNKSGTFTFYVYNTNTMDGVPVIASAGGGTNAAAFDLTGFKEGDFYMLASLDNTTLGIMEEQPLTLGHSSISNVRVQVKDSAPGYGRFAWTANSTGTSDYPVVINKISEQNAPTVLTRTMRWSRNFFHEWDYQLQGLYGLTTGDYQWWMNGQQGTFNVTWPASVSTPSLVYPRGEQLNYAKNQFKWLMDVNSTKYHLQVARQSADRGLALVIDQYYPTPYSDANGVSQADLPLYAGELGDGVYYWRVASWNPAGESAWSDAQTFAINLSATNSHWIAGNIYYFGKADASNIIVEAFANKGFSGKPDARILLTGAARTNSFKGSFTLRGLEEGTYYVRAYLDVTPAGGARDGKRNSPWESWGFIRDPNNDYQPRALLLSGTMFIDGTKLVIRDQDTDNDLLPDAWEMYYFGNLDQTGDMDYDGDGETNLEEYMRDDVDMNPAAWDTDGDGLSDAFEINYTAPSFGYSAKSGLQLNPMLWDTDGDNYSDGAEMKRYHTNPLDPTSYPRYQPMCFDAARSPGDYDGDGRSDLGVYDVTSGKWYLMTAGGLFFTLPFGNSSTQPMLGDYTGDGCDEFSLFDSSTGDWHLYDAWTGQSFSMRFGDSEMIPVPADYSGDGKTDLAVYYPAEGTWFIYNLWTGDLFTLTFGGPTMIPVPGDYNNDGAGDLAVYEPNSGDWNIFAFDHYRHEGYSYSGNFGGPTMIPVPGDYDGDGRSDAVLFDTSNSTWYILTWRGQFLSGQFGCYGCIPVAGDYDGDGRTDVCVYYPPTGMWYIYCWSGQLYQVQFGYPAATPALKGR